jgi:hypothetical protein
MPTRIEMDTALPPSRSTAIDAPSDTASPPWSPTPIDLDLFMNFLTKINGVNVTEADVFWTPTMQPGRRHATAPASADAIAHDLHQDLASAPLEFQLAEASYYSV